MLTIKPQSLSCSSRPVLGPGGRVELVVTVMASFEMQGSTAMLCSEQLFWKSLVAALPSKAVPDLGFFKPRAEWLAFGDVYPAQIGATSALANVSLIREGQLLIGKSLCVTGARTWLKRAGVAWPSDPQSINGPVKLDWSKSFGGHGHGLNPSGCGLYVETWVGQPLPQIEYPNQLVASPSDRPTAAGYGPVPLDAPDRFKPFGTYDARWKKEDFPALAGDTSPEQLMVASTDQRLDGWFKPGDVFRVEGMCPNGQSRQWVLPDWQPRCFIRRTPQGPALIPLVMHADTVMLLPQAGLLGLMWRGSFPITESDAHDVNLLFAALEDCSNPRPLSHYEDQLAIRSGTSQDAALACLDESPLLPEGQRASILPTIPKAAKAKMSQALQSAVDAREKAESSVTSAGGVAAAKPDATVDEATQIAADMVAVLSADNPDQVKLAGLVKRARALGLKGREESIKKIEAMVAKQGVDLKPMVDQKMKDMLAGPPIRRAPALQLAIEQSVKQGAINMPEAAKMREGLTAALIAATERYRRSAHWMDQPSALADPKEMGRHIADYLRANPARPIPAGSDWVGVDLSGQHLDGANLKDAFLDGASFSGASLVGANLSGATMARADLRDADLRDANLTGANLGRADLTGARLDRAILTRAILDQALLDGACLKNANLTEATLISVKLGSVDLTGANMNGCKMLGIKVGSEIDPAKLLSGKPPKLEAILSPIDCSALKANSVSFHKAALLGCTGVGAQFLKADFLNATLAHCDLKASNFSEANFKSTNVVLNSSFAGSNFQNAQIKASFFRQVDLHACDMRGADLRKSYFGLANMSQVDATGVRASSARFERTDLSEATFASAQLTGALLMGAKLNGASFDAANLTHADFSKVMVNAQTSFHKVIMERTKLDLKK